MPILRRLILAAVAALALAATAAPALAKLEESKWTSAKRELEKQLAGQPFDADACGRAVEALAADQSKRAAELIVTIGAKLDDIRVYESVKRAIGSFTEPEAIAAMLAQLKSVDPRSWTTRCVLADGLAATPGDAVTAALVKLLEDKVPYVVSTAAKSLGRRKDRSSVAGLIAKLADLEKAKDVAWMDVKQALTDITGQDLADAKEWQSFWEVRGKEFDPEKDRGNASEATTSVRDSPQFFETAIVAKKLMFVIDISGSMREKDIPAEGKGLQTRIQVVKDELIRCISKLKKDIKFNIIAFSSPDKPGGSACKYWSPISEKSSLQGATDATKQDAARWVAALQENNFTQTDEALKEAFKSVEVNQIILLSDGQPARATPQGGEAIPTGPILEMVKGLNRLRGVKINTFCFAVFQREKAAEPLLRFMEDLATQNGGKLSLVGGGGVKPPDAQPQPPKN